MKEMGANTLRLYAFKTSVRHTKFLDHAMALDLTVFAAFELGSCSMRRVSPLYLPYISTISRLALDEARATPTTHAHTTHAHTTHAHTTHAHTTHAHTTHAHTTHAHTTHAHTTHAHTTHAPPSIHRAHTVHAHNEHTPYTPRMHTAQAAGLLLGACGGQVRAPHADPPLPVAPRHHRVAHRQRGQRAVAAG